MSKIKENASGSASGAGAIASTVAPVKKRDRKKDEQAKETIFAMSAEDIEDMILVRRRAGLPELSEARLDEISPLLVMLQHMLEKYREAYEQGGDEAAIKALLQDGYKEEQVEQIAKVFHKLS